MLICRLVEALQGGDFYGIHYPYVATLMKLKFYFSQTTDITWSIDKKGWVGVKLSYVLPTTKGVARPSVTVGQLNSCN